MPGLTIAGKMVQVRDLFTLRNLSETEKPMSMHRSLKSASKVAARRNVLKRFERIEVLKAEGRWKEGDRGRGLPKTKPPV